MDESPGFLLWKGTRPQNEALQQRKPAFFLDCADFAAERRKLETMGRRGDGEGMNSILQPILPLELDNVRILNEAGVTLLAGTDVGVPFQVPDSS